VKYKSTSGELFFERTLKEWGYKTSAGQVGWRGGSTEEYRPRWGGGVVNQEKLTTKIP